MHIRGSLAFVAITLWGCGDPPESKPQPRSQRSYPSPKIIRHKIETHNAMSLIMKEEVPAILEIVITNSGGAGDVRIHASQGNKSWAERVHLGAQEQRTVRLSLPGADSGLIMFGADAEPPAP
jgi:hypothetical protein